MLAKAGTQALRAPRDAPTPGTGELHTQCSPGSKASVTGEERDSWRKDARRPGWIHGRRDLERAWWEDILYPGQRLRSLTLHRVPEREPRTHNSSTVKAHVDAHNATIGVQTRERVPTLKKNEGRRRRGKG